MVTLIISLFYLLFFFIYSTILFFVVYHISKYSINKAIKITVLPLFIVISSLLLCSNILLFLSINWNKVIGEFLSS